jgi:DNA-binding NarL/FixJ family response regulator
VAQSPNATSCSTSITAPACCWSSCESYAGYKGGATAREAEVLELVARGYTNREIGEALYVSVKTASVHVSHILRKLGVSSRVEAAAAAHRVARGK